MVNYNHIMPTRYTLDVDLKSTITSDVVENSTKKTEARKVSAPLLTNPLFPGHNSQFTFSWFYAVRSTGSIPQIARLFDETLAQLSQLNPLALKTCLGIS